MAGDRGRSTHFHGSGSRLTSAQNTLLVQSVPAKSQKQISTSTSTFNVQAKLRGLAKPHRVVSNHLQSRMSLTSWIHLPRGVMMEQGLVRGMSLPSSPPGRGSSWKIRSKWRMLLSLLPVLMNGRDRLAGVKLETGWDRGRRRNPVSIH